MPSRNVLKVDLDDAYYHIYARGASRKAIFRDDDDCDFFIKLFRRYLSDEEMRNSARIPYEKLYNQIEVLAYCLMGNHFHLLVYQIEASAMQRLMRGVMTSYSRYFNEKYQQSGGLFESRYKASMISNDEYLMHISRYIHLNPEDWRSHEYSSMGVYTDGDSDWLRPGRILGLFTSRQEYYRFVLDYKDVRDDLEMIKHELAGY